MAEQTAKDEQLTSKVDLFAGYSDWIPNRVIHGNHVSNARYGVIASATYYFNPAFGVEFAGDSHFASSNTSMRSVSIGTVYRINLPARFTVFAHVLGGAAEIVGPQNPSYYGLPATSNRVEPAWGPQLTFGGGVDWNLPFFHHRLSLRLLQADDLYQYFNSVPLAVGSRNLDTYRISSGLIFRFGVAQPSPVTLLCRATPLSVLPGEVVTVSGDPNHISHRKKSVFHWRGPGIDSGETSPSVMVHTAGFRPGTYVVDGQVFQGQHAGESARCTATFHVMPNIQ
jgi:hypothetical protein